MLDETNKLIQMIIFINSIGGYAERVDGAAYAIACKPVFHSLRWAFHHLACKCTEQADA